MKRTGLEGICLTAGLLAALGFTGPASSDPSAATAIASLTEQADGSFIAYLPGPAKPERYVRQAKRIAGDCVSLGVQHNAIHETTATLNNRCAYPVAVSWCIDGARSGAEACGALDRRAMESQQIEPGKNLPLAAAAAVTDEIYWVACSGAEAGVVSRLSQEGRSGECLAVDIDPDARQRSAAVDVR